MKTNRSSSGSGSVSMYRNTSELAMMSAIVMTGKVRDGITSLMGNTPQY